MFDIDPLKKPLMPSALYVDLNVEAIVGYNTRSTCMRIYRQLELIEAYSHSVERLCQVDADGACQTAVDQISRNLLVLCRTLSVYLLPLYH